MKKLKKSIKGLLEIIKNPWLLNNVLNDDTVWNRHLEEKYTIKNGFPVVDINQVCPNFNETINCFSFLGGGSLPTDIALLKSLARNFENCSYFEIGTWRGESVVNVADVAKECYTLNLSKEEILSLGFDEKYADLHAFFSKNRDNITHLTGNSLTYDFKKLNKKFDLIFIDGNHHYEFVKNDTKKVFEHLMHENSIVVWHDYAENPEKLRPEVIAGIIDGIPTKHRKNLYCVSNTLCAIFIQKKLPSYTFETPTTPNKIFKVTIET
ncbi:MAG: class I SAM-dependent methyltransferase [Flavobacteriales bacterium]|nr:class I SAM-dependent methyltransferase [Flavobacteriales bacterium]